MDDVDNNAARDLRFNHLYTSNQATEAKPITAVSSNWPGVSGARSNRRLTGATYSVMPSATKVISTTTCSTLFVLRAAEMNERVKERSTR